MPEPTDDLVERLMIASGQEQRELSGADEIASLLIASFLSDAAVPETDDHPLTKDVDFAVAMSLRQSSQHVSISQLAAEMMPAGATVAVHATLALLFGLGFSGAAVSSASDEVTEISFVSVDLVSQPTHESTADQAPEAEPAAEAPVAIGTPKSATREVPDAAVPEPAGSAVAKRDRRRRDSRAKTLARANVERSPDAGPPTLRPPSAASESQTKSAVVTIAPAIDGRRATTHAATENVGFERVFRSEPSDRSDTAVIAPDRRLAAAQAPSQPVVVQVEPRAPPKPAPPAAEESVTPRPRPRPSPLTRDTDAMNPAGVRPARPARNSTTQQPAEKSTQYRVSARFLKTLQDMMTQKGLSICHVQINKQDYAVRLGRGGNLDALDAEHKRVDGVSAGRVYRAAEKAVREKDCR